MKRPAGKRRAGMPDPAYCTTRQLRLIFPPISFRMFQWWDERGVLEPLVWHHTRYYTPDQAIEAGVVFDLRSKHMALATASYALQTMRRYVRQNHEPPAYLLLDGGKPHATSDLAVVVGFVKRSHQGVTLVDVAEIAAKVRQILSHKARAA
jgi:hypothetical protein